MRKVLLPLMVMAALAPMPAQASRGSCNIRQDDLVSKQLSRAKSLIDIYKISMRFPGCLQGGATAEEASDDIVVRLSHRWNRSITELRTHHTDRFFIAFVLRHIDATTDSEDLQTIVHETISRCPIGAHSICGKVGAAAGSALQDLKRLGIGA